MEDSPGATLVRPPVLRPPSCDDPVLIAGWCLGRGASGLAAALELSIVPATVLSAHLLAALAGAPGDLPGVRVGVWRSCERPATPGECASLRCPAGTPVSERHAVMRAVTGPAGLVAEIADVESVVIPSRLPEGAGLAPGSTVSLGTVIAEIGWRQPVGASLHGGGVAAAAFMWRGGTHRVAWAHEVFRPWFCDRLAEPPPSATLG